MEETSDEINFIHFIKKNSDPSKIISIIDVMKKKGLHEFMNKLYSEKRSPLICM